MSTTETHTNREPKRRCPYCDWEGPGRGLTFHVLNCDDDDHGVKYDLPDEFNASDAEVVGQSNIKVRMPQKYDVSKRRRYVCDYCGKVCRGEAGLNVHLSHLSGDEVHPEDCTDRTTDSFPSFRVDGDGNLVSQEPSALHVATGGALPPSDSDEDDSQMIPLDALMELRDAFINDEQTYGGLSPVEAAERVQKMMDRYGQPANA